MLSVHKCGRPAIAAISSLVLLGFASCAGDSPEPESEPGGAPSAPMSSMGGAPSVETPQLVPGGALRRVSVRSLHATLDRLFPELAATRPAYPPDTFKRYDTELGLDPGLAFAETTAVVMADLVKQARKNPNVWARVRTCAATADAAACVGEFYDAWAPRLLRRPGVAEERAELVGLASQDLGDVDELLAVALETLLRHPEFTHRVELGEGSGPQRSLAQHEIQSRMAYLLWGEAPDDTLRSVAADLKDPNARLTLAKEMLAEPRGQRQILDYHSQWIGFFAMPRGGIGQDMWDEASALIRRVVFEGVPYEQLFLSEETYLTPALAEHYGLPAPSVPGWTSTAGSGRLGLFGQGAFLQAFSNIADTSPVKRGKNVLSRFLCIDIDLPENADVNVDAQPQAGQCRAQFFREVHAAGPCAGCHIVMDGVGFALETFDKTGKPRTHEPDAPHCPLDGRGVLNGVPIDGAAGLAKAITEDAALDACIAKNALQFALGVSPSDSAEGRAWIKDLTARYVASGGRFDSLLLGMVEQPQFVQVAPR